MAKYVQILFERVKTSQDIGISAAWGQGPG